MLELGLWASRSLFGFICIALPLPLGLSRKPRAAAVAPCGLWRPSPKLRREVALRPEEAERTPTGHQAGAERTSKGPPRSPLLPTAIPGSKSRSADLPALVMIISVPASWNFFQSSFSCSPTLMFSMVWGREGEKLVSAWPRAPRGA